MPKVCTWVAALFAHSLPYELYRWGAIRDRRAAMHAHFVGMNVAAMVSQYTHAGLFDFWVFPVILFNWGRRMRLDEPILRGVAVLALLYFGTLRICELQGLDPYRYANYITLEDYEQHAPWLYFYLQVGRSLRMRRVSGSNQSPPL